jgi:Tfp pilus assembly protein PilN
MIRSNLATRPFYNERAVHLLLALAAILVLAVTAYNVYRIVTMSRHNTELSSKINADRSEAARLTQEARRIRAGINQAELQAIVTSAQQANQLIYQRTFSWTEFFNHIEDTLPPDVMLTSVVPSYQQDRTTVLMNILARETQDVDDFIANLEETGAFADVLPQQEDLTDEGLHRVVLNATYTGVSVEEMAPAGEPAPAGPGETPPADPATPAGPDGRGGRGR